MCVFFLTFARLCPARRGPACTPRHKFGSRAGFVARALGIQSREIWNFITGLLSAEVEPGNAIENPHFSHFHSCIILLGCCTATQPRQRYSLQAFPVVTAADTTYAATCVCCVCLRLNMRGSGHVCAGTWKSFLWYGFLCVGIDTLMQVPFNINTYTSTVLIVPSSGMPQRGTPPV